MTGLPHQIVKCFGAAHIGIIDPVEPCGQYHAAQYHQRAALVLAGEYAADRHPHRAVQPGGAGAIVGRQIPVAAAERHAIGLAHRGHADHAIDMRTQEVEIARHAADDRQLLPVFFAKQRQIGPNLVEQFQHHRRHAIEMAGAAHSAQHAVQPGHGNFRGKTLRIHFAHGRRPQQIDAGFAQQRAVLHQLARIGVEILVRAELQRIDEDRHRHAIGHATRLAHQHEVPVVQRAHRRHQRQGFSPAFERGQRACQIRTGRDSLHGARLSFIVHPV